MDGQRGKDVSLTSCKVCVVTSRPPGLILEPKEGPYFTKQGSASAYFRRRRFIHPGQWMEVEMGKGGREERKRWGREGGKKERDGGGREVRKKEMGEGGRIFF